MTRVVACIVSALFMLLFAPLARADLDVDRAGKDAHGYTQQGQQAGFCTHPSKLSDDGDRLCPLSGQTEGCDGFKKACAETTHTERSAHHEPEPDKSDFSRVLAQLAHVLLWVMIAAIVIVAIVLVAQAFRRAREDQRLADAKPAEPKLLANAPPDAAAAPPITDAELLLRRAAEFANAGNYEGALFTYLEASLRALDIRGALRIAKDRTYGEYVRACKDPYAKAPLGDIVREVDRVKFGGVIASADASSRAAERAVRLVRAAMTALMIALFLVGCGGDSVKRSLANDPAGYDVLIDLLNRQLIDAGPLHGSLANLPIPTEDAEDVPAVMVDFERTKVDESTSKHLMEWTRAGGTLIITSNPGTWPKDLLARYETTTSTTVTATVVTGNTYDEASEELVPSTKKYSGKVAEADALHMECDAQDPKKQDQNTLVWIDETKSFAAICFVGDGMVIGVANDDLFTNIGMLPPGNAQIAFAILSRMHAMSLRIAQPMDGIEPPSSPISSIDRAGLGLGMWHAIAAAFILFFAVGVRLSRAAKPPPDTRRAFTEHVEATGLVYARARAASHALTAFAKFADERLRYIMPRGVSDPAAFLAMRSGVSADECDRIWKRASSAKSDQPLVGDELDTLRRLTTLYAQAMRRN